MFSNRIYLGIILCLLVTSGCHRQQVVYQSEANYIEVTSTASNQTESEIQTILKPYRDSVSKEMDMIIGSSSVAMEKGKPESLLVNFVSDVCKAEIDSFLIHHGKPSLDFFIFNNGGLRGALPEGSITMGNVYQVMPFDNELVWVDLPYDSLVSVIRYIREKGGVPVSGITIKLNGDGLENVTLSNGKPLNASNSFRIGTNDFLARGGDGMNMLSIESNIQSTGVKVRDALINHIRKMAQSEKTIGSVYDGRIKP